MKSNFCIKILIILPKPSSIDTTNYNYFFPIGLAYISSVLKNNGYFVDCLNCYHESGANRDIIRHKLDHNLYDFICTGNTALGYNETAELIDEVRNHKSKPDIILGGVIITAEPYIVFNDLKPTYGVLGDGEETIIELLNHIIAKKSLTDVLGIIYEGYDGEIVINKPRKIFGDLDLIPFPDFESLSYYEKLEKNIYSTENVFASNIIDKYRPYYIMASRSCPYSCTFCYHESKYRERSIENVFAEIEEVIIKHKINYIFLIDEVLATKKNKERLLLLCRKMSELRSKITWGVYWCCQMKVDVVDEELLEIMKNAGCLLISYGFESYSPAVLKSMRKSITPKQIDNTFKHTLKAKIAVQANFIFFDIAETSATVSETLKYWKENACDQINLAPLKPYPGSGIYKYCITNGIINDSLEFLKHIGDMKDYAYNMTTDMKDYEVLETINKFDYLSVKYRKAAKPENILEAEKNLYKISVVCPYCGSVVDYDILLDNIRWFAVKKVCGICSYRFLVTSTYNYYFEVLSRKKIFYYIFHKLKKNIKQLLIKYIPYFMNKYGDTYQETIKIISKTESV